MRQLSPDPLSLSAEALGAGVGLLLVTLGPRGVAYVAAPGFAVGRNGGTAVAESSAESTSPSLHSGQALPPYRPTGIPHTALIPAPRVETLDPTGCGDVFGAAAFARLLAGDPVESALRQANELAARNAAFRGAGGLARYLRGELVTP